MDLPTNLAHKPSNGFFFSPERRQGVIIYFLTKTQLLKNKVRVRNGEKQIQYSHQ
jgi:hypothetical protein